MVYRKYRNLLRTRVKIISDPNYLVRILFQGTLVRTSYFSRNLEEEKVLDLR